MKRDKLIEKWNRIPNKHINYNGVEIVGEIEMLKHFTRKELDNAEKNGWLYNNHAEYDMAEPSYNLIQHDSDDTITLTKKELETFMNDLEEGVGVWSDISYRICRFIGIDPSDGV